MLSLMMLGVMAQADGEAASRLTASVVHLEVQNQAGVVLGNGTGWLATSSGRVVTNAHVVEHAAKLEAVFSDGKRVKVLGVLAEGDKTSNDLAVLQLEPGTYPALDLETPEVAVGTPVSVIGSPRGLKFTLSRGIVSALRLKGLTAELDDETYTGPVIQVSVPIAPGSSGSPVVNTAGNVIGVIASGFGGTGELHFAVPSASVKAMLDSLGADAKPPLFNPRQIRNLIITAVLLAGLIAWWLIRGARAR